MKAFTIIIAVFIFIATLHSCNTDKSQTAQNTPPSKDSLVKRGAYLVAIMGCNDCHSPKHMGPQGPEVDILTALSGFPGKGAEPVADPKEIQSGLVVFNGDLTAAIGPWGTSFSANITSDDTGIGTWSEAQFKNALTKGKYRGIDQERMLMPPMPWQDFSNLKDEDVNAIFEYLKTTKPVKNIPPDFRPATPKK